MKKTELLIPVGNMETLWAAINGGADAVYLGGKKYGARAYADNFTDEELVVAIKTCHLFKVKAYVTVNTMVYNNELSDVLNYLKYLYENNVDAVIMQDNGLISYIKKYLPGLVVHVSTQAHTHNEVMCEYYHSIGCERVVFDREMSLKDIADIKTPIEKEVFVYGALCVCYSGNCLFSALNGGRSANRGMCVGSCRLPYKLFKNDRCVNSGYPLSTFDLNTMDRLKELLDLGIDSLKIEGRMKSKEYVLLVSKIYRKLIDDYYNGKDLVISSEDKNKLLKTYNRGFTEGYLFDSDGIINGKNSNHQGVVIGEVISVNNKKIGIKLIDYLNQGDAIRFDNVNYGMYVNSLYDDKGLLINGNVKGNVVFVDNKERIMYKDLIGSKVLKTIDIKLNHELENVPNKKLPIGMKFIAHAGYKTTLAVFDDTYNVLVEGFFPEIANNRPVSSDRVKEQLEKLGNTIYSLDFVDIDMDDNLFINIKDLNELRREAITKFEKQREEKTKLCELKMPVFVKTKSVKPKISVLVRNMDQLTVALKNNVDFIYVTDENLYNKYKDRDSIYYVLSRVNTHYKDYKNEKLLCTEFGSVIKYGTDNKIRTSYGLNVANDLNVNTMLKLNSTGICLSLEIECADTVNINNRECCEYLVYGKTLCMIIKNNIYNISNEKCFLENSKGDRYPVISDGVFTYVYNYKNIDYLDKLDKLNGLGTYRIDLFDEDAMKTQLIISKLRNKIGG